MGVMMLNGKPCLVRSVEDLSYHLGVDVSEFFISKEDVSLLQEEREDLRHELDCFMEEANTLRAALLEIEGCKTLKEAKEIIENLGL